VILGGAELYHDGYKLINYNSYDAVKVAMIAPTSI